MMKLLAIVAALAVATNAISISWTGYGNDNQWTNKVNWSPDQVPSTGDDVTIASGIVQVTIPTGVNSLVMGTSFNAPANLTVFQSFFIGTGGLQVEGNGNLFINSGTAAVSGQVTIGGNLYFQSGQISGQWTIN
ncbi:membrane-associated protein, putative, partial [Bodo saltans]